MKRRNPLFVAGFPYVMFFVGFVGLQIFTYGVDENESISTAAIVALIVFFVLLLVGTFYTYYWLIVTASVLRRETGKKIPLAILLIIPLANYWWMWRYAEVAEVYVKSKQPSALIFVLVALLGSIGNGIVQDMYNKVLIEPEQPLPTQA